ncbi:jasmonate-induced oxygenase 4 isoform X2 [Triticum aestivum]|uniref:jasmonate-induced oxygenase 4 isoform X2 n=1 Tax=Triticum aestivum TaxID=4565 RepID=UPI001D0336A8|nr:jasmonate-induced oxygenase 4-like isoform X2 [Triticum aestivum]
MASSNLLDWPEPIVPVQTLSNSGMSSLPQQYIKPPSERPSDVTNDPNLSIPVIDLASFSNAPEHHQEMLKAIASACKNWGFFQLVNHDVDTEAVRRMRSAWREFFDLPMEEKKVHANLPVTYEGYGSRLGVEKGAILDWSDYYFLNLFPSDIRNLDKWPKIPTDLREATEKYACQLISLCQVLLKAMSSSLGLEEDYLHNAFGGSDGISATMRVNYYPRCPQPELTLGLSSHSDPGGITLLLTDDNVEGTQILSNGCYRSVEHRALANSDKERFTISFFCNPRGDLPIAPARELVGPGSPALYQEALTFSDYRKYMRTKGPSGKTQVQSISSAMQPGPAA